MKRQTLVHALGLLRQRAGHKALMDAMLLREHRETPHHQQQQHGLYCLTGATTSESVGKTNGTDGVKRERTLCVLCNIRGKVEEQEGLFCCWGLNIGRSCG